MWFLNFYSDVFFDFLFLNTFNFYLVLNLIVLFLLLFFSAIYDLKFNYIPNYFSYFLICFSLLSNLIMSIQINNVNFISWSIILGIFVFGLSYIMWVYGFWAGGDVKIFTAIAMSTSLLSFSGFNSNLIFFNFQYNIIPFVFYVFINGIFILFPFILIYVLINFIKSYYGSLMNLYWENKLDKSEEIDLNYIKYGFFNLDFLLYFGSIILFNFFNIFKLGSRRNISIYELKESMVLENCYFNNSQIYNKILSLANDENNNDNEDNEYNLIVEKNSNESLCDLILANSNYSKLFNENYLYSFKSATVGGLTSRDIELIEEFYELGLISDVFSIKLTVPFLPSVFIGYVISMGFLFFS